MFLFGSASLSLVLYLLLMLILKKFAARGSGCIIRPEPLNHGKQSPLSPPHFHFSLLSLTSNRRAFKKKRREATEKEDGGRKELQEETREVMWWEGKASYKMNEFLRREEERIYVFILFFFFLNQAQRAFPANFVQQHNARVGRWKRSVLLSGCRLQLALLPSWSAWICTQLSSCLSGRLSLSPREIRPRSDPAYLHTQAQSAHLKKTTTPAHTHMKCTRQHINTHNREPVLWHYISAGWSH